MHRLLFGLLLLTISGSIYAQTFSQVLSARERDYDEGRLLRIPESIEPKIGVPFKEGGFSREENIRALKLMTKVFIFLDDEPTAEEYLVKLLKADKEHRLNPEEDPAELFFLYQKFRSKPIFRLGLRFGVNKTFPNVIQTYSTGNTGITKKIYNGSGTPPNQISPDGTLGIGNWVELVGERHLKWGIEGIFGFQYRATRYDIDHYVGHLNVDDAPSLSTYMVNQQNYLRFPGSIRYNFRYFSDRGPIPYVAAGASYDYLLDAFYGEASRSGGTQFVLSQEDNLKDLYLTNYHNLTFSWAAGVKLRVQTHFLTLEVRYDKGMSNYINEDNRWNGNQFLTYDLGFVEDDLALDVLSFSIGYTYSVYSPQKLKAFR
ncbi:MAG: hypothetical protein JXQ90_23995 [Cyclobacteriaceae bacterium]